MGQGLGLGGLGVLEQGSRRPQGRTQVFRPEGAEALHPEVFQELAPGRLLVKMPVRPPGEGGVQARGQGFRLTVREQHLRRANAFQGGPQALRANFREAEFAAGQIEPG